MCDENLAMVDQEANLGYLQVSESEDESSSSHRVDGEVDYVLGLLVECQLRGVINNLLLCAMVLMCSFLVTVNLIGRGDCEIVPSGGPGTVSQLQFGIIQSRLGSSNYNAEDGGSDGLAT